MSSDNEYLTVEQTAILASRSAGTVRRWEREGRLPAVRILGRVCFRKADVERLLRPVAPANTHSKSAEAN